MPATGAMKCISDQIEMHFNLCLNTFVLYTKGETKEFDIFNQKREIG